MAKRRTVIERERLLARVERKVLMGLDTPGKLLAALPEIGSRDTARNYLHAVHARWEEMSNPKSNDRARCSMIGNCIRMRELAWQNALECESPSAKVQFMRIIDRTIEREQKLRGLTESSSPTTVNSTPGSTRLNEWQQLSDQELYLKVKELEIELTPDDNEEAKLRGMPARQDRDAPPSGAQPP